MTAATTARAGGAQTTEQYVCRRPRGIASQGKLYRQGDVVPASAIRASWVTLGWIAPVAIAAPDHANEATRTKR